MTPTATQESQKNDRSFSFSRRASTLRWTLPVAAVLLLMVAGSASAQLPALPALPERPDVPVDVEHHTGIASPVGGASADIADDKAMICADANADSGAVPVPALPALPIQTPALPKPGAQASGCVEADIDDLQVDAEGRAHTYGVDDPTGLAPTQLGAKAGADADALELDADADTDNAEAQGALDTITGAVKNVWSMVKGLF